MRPLAICILAAALLPACATRDNYLVNRVADFSDILRLHVMAGPGIAVKADAFRMVHVGGAYTENVYAWGWHNRAIGSWKESIRSWGLIVGHHSEEIIGLDRYSGDYGWQFGDGGLSLQPATGSFDLDLLSFRVQLAFLVGVDVELRLGEVLDFVAGIFQFDPAGDDRDYENMRKADLPEPMDASGEEDAMPEDDADADGLG
jgi:hypothetical protein